MMNVSGLLHVVDSASLRIGEGLRYFCLVLVAVVCFGVAMRYVFHRPLIHVQEIVVQLAAAYYALSFVYTAVLRRHVRVDVIYSRLNKRAQALIDVAGTVVFMIPLLISLIVTNWRFTLRSWATGEMSQLTHLYVPMSPLRTVVFIGFVLVLIQILAQLVRDVYFLRKGDPIR